MTDLTSFPIPTTTISLVLAAPPAIGGTTPAAGNFTTLGATGAAAIGGVVSVVPVGQATLQLGSPSVATTPYIDFHAGATNAGYDTRLIASSNGSVNGSGTLSLSGTFLISPGNFFTTQQGLNISQLGPLSGSVAGIAYNIITVSDGLNTSNQVTPLEIDYSILANAGGEKYGIFVNVNHNVATTIAGDQIAGVFFAQSTKNAGGTNTGAGAAGTIFGTNPNVDLESGATNYNIVAGEEVDVTVAAGASTKNKLGVHIAGIGTNGAVIDSAISVTSSSAPWNAALNLNRLSGGSPLSAASSVITSDGNSETITNVISLPTYTVTGKYLDFANFSVTGAGALSAASGAFTTPLPVASGGTGDNGSAWSTWSPTVASLTGTITTVGAVVARYKTIGKTVNFYLSITITTNGTGATALTFTLPVAPNASSSPTFAGVNLSNSSALSSYASAAGSSTVYSFFYNATYPVASGQTVLFTGVYESA